MQEVRPGIFRHVSAWHGDHHPVNSYAVHVANRETVLIDPAQDLTPACLATVGIEHVSDILVTHVQAEHVNGCFQFPDAKVHVPLGDEYLTEGLDAYRKLDTVWHQPWEWDDRGRFQGHLAGAMNERPPLHPLKIHGVLRPGDRLAGFDVLSTPGHGKNAVTFLIEMNGQRLGFCGDLICEDGKLWNWFDAEWDYGLQTGLKSLLASAERLASERVDTIFPGHGEPITNPAETLATFQSRLSAIVSPQPKAMPRTALGSIDFPEHTSDAPGFRQLLPHVMQWNGTAGNCAVLLSSTQRALLIDDGLCYWKPAAQRAEHHAQALAGLKQAMDITAIDTVIITHYHGDHIENIPALVADEGAHVVTLDTVAEVVEHPDRFNLACRLAFYDTGVDTIRVDERVPDGSGFQWNEYELELFHLGGQTYYHCGIAARVDGRNVLFVGDAIGSNAIECDPVICYNDAEPSRRGWVYALDRMIERSPDLLVCGHAVAVADPMALLLRRRALWQTQLERFDRLNPHDNRRRFFDPFSTKHLN